MGSEGGWWKRIRLYRQGMVSVKREEGGDFSLGRQSGLVGDPLQISVWTFFFFFEKPWANRPNYPMGIERASVSCHAPRPIVDCVPSRRACLPASSLRLANCTGMRDKGFQYNLCTSSTRVIPSHSQLHN